MVKRLIQSAGARNFAKLLSANVVAQAIGLLVYPVLTRLYAPDDFGLLNLFLSIGGIHSRHCRISICHRPAKGAIRCGGVFPCRGIMAVVSVRIVRIDFALPCTNRCAV